MNTHDVTQKLLDIFSVLFPQGSIKKEWDAAKNSQDDFDRNEFYAPRVDIAIGPFNIDRQIEINNRRFSTLIQDNLEFLHKLYDISHLGENLEYISFDSYLQTLNKNPRCFIALEIENTKAAKRALGDIVNASAMGKIGIVIPVGQDKYEMFIKIKKYFHYLEQVGKLEGNFRNLLIIEASKFIESFSNNKIIP
jgi:hypothetical protein